MVMTIGRPITVGVMKEANKFSFILILKGFLFLMFGLFLMRVIEEMIVNKFLVETR